MIGLLVGSGVGLEDGFGVLLAIGAAVVMTSSSLLEFPLVLHQGVGASVVRVGMEVGISAPEGESMGKSVGGRFSVGLSVGEDVGKSVGVSVASIGRSVGDSVGRRLVGSLRPLPFFLLALLFFLVDFADFVSASVGASVAFLAFLDDLRAAALLLFLLLLNL